MASDDFRDAPDFAIREAFAALGGTQKSSSISAWINSRYPNRWTDRRIGTYLRGGSVNQTTAIGYHKDFARFLFCRGRGEFELYNPEQHGSYDDRGYLEGEAPETSVLMESFREMSDELQGKREFANEAQLRDYLARNLGLLEAGLTLWTGREAESVEYALEGRRIDILAKDRNGIPVVVELKLSKGHERTLGQALYYRGKLKQMLKVARVRIIMVAAEITDELRIASTEVTDVDVFSYELTMQVQKVDLTSVDVVKASGEMAVI